MKIIQKIHIALLAVVLMAAASCEKDLVPKALKTGETPGPVKNYTYESIPGGAIITYDLPEGSDLRYVKATYTLNSGQVRESKSTVYKNTIQVDGFASEGEYDIQLRAVGLGDVESEPIMAKIKALRPSHKLLIDSVKLNGSMYAAFGGLNVDFKNYTGSSVVFHVLAKDAADKWQEIQTAYSSAKIGRIRTRGLEPVARDFAVYVTDRWNNRSDTASLTLTPFKEALITTKFAALTLSNDTWEYHTGQGRARPLVILFDGLHAQNSTIFQTKPSSVMPQWFTFDMIQPFRLSRFILYADVPISDRNVFIGGQPLEFELWGSNSPAASFDSWTLVGSFKSVKPSGSPLGVVTAEDIAQAKNGEEFEVEGNAGNFRYWRFKTVSTWGSVPYLQLSELTFYGAL
ncbi:DUF5000 domain-containing lipoprotein [Pedobacter metabolipauper]|uniref:Uncharacterized protein DUF5126 n=1 Tax=Pedobacter metabolipauper TaxID=425513 RepID=A0A4R6STJ9_9SPHI|nr:DUF5000 domain-containing lipoprotein [Pedobacter metabolipauper]TDQ08080.1 uncharacterized protein DUF5126 [Pedobacter metabolipauper]